jgi:diacylglycerol kinase (ATP)
MFPGSPLIGKFLFTFVTMPALCPFQRLGSRQPPLIDDPSENITRAPVAFCPPKIWPIQPISASGAKTQDGIGKFRRKSDGSRAPIRSRSEKKPHLVVLENPASGYNSRNPGVLKRLCEAAGVVYRAGRTSEEIEDGIAELLALEPDILVVSGGDGTISSILGAMGEAINCSKKPVLALLQGGSTNMTHRELGLRGNPKQALQALLDIVQVGMHEKYIQWRAPLGVRIEGETKEELGFFFAVGAMPRVFRVCQAMSANGMLRGLAAETLVLGSSFLQLLFGDTANTGALRPESVQWTQNKTESTRRWQGGSRIFVYLTSLNRLIFGFDPRGRRDALKLVGFKHPFSKWTLVTYLLSRGRSGRFKTTDVEHDSVDEYSLNFKGQWVLDGEFYGEHGMMTTLSVRTCEPVPFFTF